MAFSYPQDTEEFKKERKSYQLLFYRLNADVWAPNGSDNTDHGMDYGFEYIENGNYKGYRILSQIKSTEHIIKSKKSVSFDLKVITAAYAISSAQPFVLFVVDLIADVIYYICLQDFFIDNPASLKAVGNIMQPILMRMDELPSDGAEIVILSLSSINDSNTSLRKQTSPEQLLDNTSIFFFIVHIMTFYSR